MALTVPLTPARRAILVAGVPVALALIGLATWGWGHAAVNTLANGDQVGYSVRFSAPVSGSQSRLTVSNADITVRPGGGRLIRGGGSLLGSIARPSFQRQDTAHGLVLNPSCPVRAGNCLLSLHVLVPATLPVTASDSFGNLTASGLTGKVTLTGDSGDLTADRLNGTIRLSNQFGEVDAVGLAGGIQIVNSNGDITASRVTGDTRLQTSFGTISVTGLAAADVAATDSNGDIRLVFSKVPRHVTVTDSFGNVTLVLPRGPATYQLHAPRPQFGVRTITVPGSPSSRNVITVQNSNGNITITNG